MTEKRTEYMDIIKEKYPEIYMNKIEKNIEGQNNDVIVINDEYIFRFPKYEQGIESLEIEARLLTSLKNYISLDIPKPEYCSFNERIIGRTFMGYKKIPGNSLRKEDFEIIKDKQAIANQLSCFLYELHNIPIQELSEFHIPVGSSYEKWHSMYLNIKEKLFKYMRKDATSTIKADFDEFLNSVGNITDRPVLVHGDFGPSNILVDRKAERITGVIDFSCICLGDPAVDIASLIGPFGYGESFIRMFDKSYHDIDAMIKRAKFYASTFALQEALFGYDNNDEKAFKSGMSQYI